MPRTREKESENTKTWVVISSTERFQMPSTTSKSESLWEFVPLAEYTVPGLPARGALQKYWMSLKQRFRRVDNERAPFRREEELRALDAMHLDRLLAPLDWAAPAAALDSALQEWLKDEAANGTVRFVIGQPHGGHDKMLRHWATGHKARVISPPDCEEILAGDLHWLEKLPVAEGLWVLPNLEQCYLRHPDGLLLVRRLLEASESGRLGRGLIGCESWAWAYLQRVWPVMKPDALTLHSFDGPRLACLLTRLTVSTSGKPVCYRNARTGEAILTAPSDAEKVRPEIIQLAAHCRGNFGIALHYWRKRLRTEPEVDESKPDERAEVEKKAEAGERVVWVVSEMPDPIMPLEKDDDPVLVLHALLLHGGLPETLVPELLPLSPTQCMSILLRLRNAGLVRWEEERWIVTEPAYATVREILRGRDYLVDHF